ncbi:transcription factor collier [Caerostris extrusa]|uniref:Transcription factor collier n=1 Tax=Caerostris extrusa TaxID=172846 RepID=A0AAV4TCB6_CAEEX|nr:transcription factor collier [Caerostris extrusa]
MSDSDLDKGIDAARSSRIVVHNNSKKAKDMLAIYNLIPEFGHPGSSLVICGKYFDKDTMLFVAGKPVPVTPQRPQLTDWHLSNPSMNTQPWTEPMPNCEYHWSSIPTARNQLHPVHNWDSLDSQTKVEFKR